MEGIDNDTFNELLKQKKMEKMMRDLGFLKDDPGLAAKLLGGLFSYLPLSLLLYIIFYILFFFVDQTGNATLSISPALGGLAGLLTGISAGVGEAYVEHLKQGSR